MVNLRWVCGFGLFVLVFIGAMVGLFIAAFQKHCVGGFKHAAVAADSLTCSNIGKDILLQGGSAADGAIAALLCTSVINPQSMGIGGGSIVTIRNTSGNVMVYNFRESLPEAFKQSLLTECPTTPQLYTGTKWVGVPGELLGYKAIHKQYGKLPWDKLFLPTIKLAREGFPLPAVLSKMMKIPAIQNMLEKSPMCEVFCSENKKILNEGDLLKFPKLADTLETIAQEGVEVFYNGKIGEDLISDMIEEGGTMTMDDLKSYKVTVEKAWTVPLGDRKLHVAPPPSGGPLIAFILQLMTGSDVSRRIDLYHHYVEAAKFANGQLKYILDPLIHPKVAEHLIDPSFINRIKKKITSKSTHDNAYYDNLKPSSDHFGTTHVSVVDKDGLAVAATSTINHIFGGGVYSKRTGIILNNELADFCGRVTKLAAGERPPSSMTPAVLELESGGLLVIGGSGGRLITSSVSMSIINRLWLGMSLKDAIAAPIIFVDSGNKLNFEPGFDEEVILGLITYGHESGGLKFFLNVVNAIEKVGGCFYAVSDARKKGEPAGY